MDLLRVLRLRLRALFARERLNRELEEEIQLHIDLQAEANERAGMTPQEARRQAVLLFGGVEGHKEASRAAQGWELMGARASWLDFRLGLRMLAKYPGLTLVGGFALTVATGLGAAFFEFTEKTIDPRLPLPDGDRIVTVQTWDLAAAAPERRSLSDFVTWREEVRSIADLGVFQAREQTVGTEQGYSELLEVGRMSASTFRMTGVVPLLGRTLLPEDERPGASPAVVIGHPVWQRFFGGDPGVVGRTLRVGAAHATVVGVMPEGYGFPASYSVWTPFPVAAAGHAPRQGPPVMVFGKLRPGVSLQEAQAELAAIGARASADSPATHERLRPRVLGFIRAFIPDAEVLWAIRGMRLLFVVLMIVMCVNVTTLVFARTAARESEFAVRSALGASRRRIVLQLFLEALALSLLAAAVGLAAAWVGLRWGMDLFWRAQGGSPPFWWNDALSPETVLYAVGLAVVGAAMVGVVPALRVTGRRVQPTLSRLAAGSPRLRFGGVWTVIVVLQVALSVAFLPGAVVEGRNALRDAERDTGFPADAYLTGRLVRELDAPLAELPAAEREAAAARTAALMEEAKRRAAAVPGVAGVAFADRVPAMNHAYEPIVFDHDVPTPLDSVADPEARSLAVDADYFGVMGARVVAGRGFRPAGEESEASVVVGRTFVAEMMRGQNPVGQRIRYPGRLGEEGERWYQVVGVVEDPAMDAFGPGSFSAVYHPLAAGGAASLRLFVRTDAPAATVGPRLRAVIGSIDPSLRPGELVTVRQLWAADHEGRKVFAALQMVVALVGLLLSMAGVHALMAFTVSQRTREIGIRAALGAHPRRIVASIFSRALLQLGAGVLLGTVLALAARWEDVATDGPLALTAIVTSMLAVGLLACWVPARRALRIQPTEALRAGG